MQLTTQRDTTDAVEEINTRQERRTRNQRSVVTTSTKCLYQDIVGTLTQRNKQQGGRGSTVADGGGSGAAAAAAIV